MKIENTENSDNNNKKRVSRTNKDRKEKNHKIKRKKTDKKMARNFGIQLEKEREFNIGIEKWRNQKGHKKEKTSIFVP